MSGKNLVTQEVGYRQLQQLIHQDFATQLRDTASLTVTSMVDLTALFLRLAEQAEQQRDTLNRLAATTQMIDQEGGPVAWSSFIQQFEAVLNESISSIVAISKDSIEAIYSMERASESMTQIEGFIGRIHQVMKQTKMLAMNAKIEAARAGAQGDGFAVVAEEVKSVSDTITQLADDMQSRVTNVASSVHESYAILQRAATTDMSKSLQHKRELEAVIQAVVIQNERIAAILSENALQSGHLSSSLAQAVMELQFPDRVNQYLCNIADALSGLHAVQPSGQDEPLTPGELSDILEHLASCLRINEMRKHLAQHLKTAGIDFQQSAAPPAALQPSDDNIELF